MRRARRRWFAGTGVVLVVLAGCRAFLDLEEGTDTDAGILPGEAGPGADSDVQPDAPPPVCPAYAVTFGRYTYEDENFAVPSREKLVQLQNGVHKPDGAVIERQLPSNFFATAREIDGGRSTFRFDFNDIHFDEYTFEPSTTQSGLRVSRVVESLLNIPVDVTCEPSVEAIRCPMVVDTGWQAAANGFFSNTRFDAKLTFHVVGEEDIAIGGQLVPTWHVLERRTLSGAIAGNMTVDYWFAKSDGLLIRGRIAGGDVTTKTVDGLTMVVRRPRTLRVQGPHRVQDQVRDAHAARRRRRRLSQARFPRFGT